MNIEDILRADRGGKSMPLGGRTLRNCGDGRVTRDILGNLSSGNYQKEN
jgi:hypothetical protein